MCLPSSFLLLAIGIGVMSARTATPTQTHVVPATQARAADVAHFDLIDVR
jgi:hypothetical protein